MSEVFNAPLTEAERKVMEFASAKGWMGKAIAEQVIRRGRNAKPLPWIKSEMDHALYAVRHATENRKMTNGQPND